MNAIQTITMLAMLATIAPGVLNAADNASAPAVKATPANAEFIQRAYEFNTAQIQLGKLAEQRVQKGTTFGFAVKLLTDHAKVAELLAPLAAKASVILSPQIDATHQTLLARLAGVSDQEFDYDYVSAVMLEQKQAIALFEEEAKREQAPDYQALINAVLPMLREHLKAAPDALAKLAVPQGLKLPDKLVK